MPNDIDEYEEYNDNEQPLIPHLILTSDEIVNQMITLYQEEYLAGQSPISDFIEGSQKRNTLASNSIEGEQLRWLIDLMLMMGFVKHAVGGWLDLLGEEYNTLRLPAISSYGTLSFTYEWDEDYDPSNPPLPEPPITIPAFSLIAPSTNPGLEYETLETVIVEQGSTVNIPSQCSMGGVLGNIGAGKIDTIVDDNDEIWDLKVTNPEPFTGGWDEEDDDPYRARILLNKKGSSKGVRDWYISIAMGVSGVHDVLIISMPYSVKFTVGIVVNGNIKPTIQSVLNNVSNAFLIENETDIEGTNVSVRRPKYRAVDYKINTTIKPEYLSIVEENIKNDLRAFHNGGVTSQGARFNGFMIGESFNLNQIYPILTNINHLTNYWVILPDTVVNTRPDEVLILGDVELV